MMRLSKMFYLILIALLVVTGCQKESDLSNLEDTIYVRNDGADMPAFIYGNGTSNVFIVILHGGPGDNGLGYRTGEYYKELENRYAMVYWDQRGQGSSHGHYGEGKVNIPQMVEDVRDLLLVLKHKYGSDISLFLLGHSWGGTLGTAFMVTDDYQHLIKGWIESDGAHDIPLLNKEAIKMFITIGEDEIAKGNHLKKWHKIVDFAKNVDTSNITFDDGDKINEYAFQAEEILKQVHQPNYTYNTFNEYLRSPVNYLTSGIVGILTDNILYDEVETTSLTNQLKHITIPCLFVWGKYDFVVSPALAYDAYEKVQSDIKELAILEHSGHSPMDNEPEAFNNAVINFIEANK